VLPYSLNYPVEMSVFRCIWTSADCRIRATCADSCILTTVPKITSSLRCYYWLPRGNGFRILDVQWKDCTLDRSFLLSVGYRICQKVSIDFNILYPTPTLHQIYPNHCVGVRTSTYRLAVILYGSPILDVYLPCRRHPLLQRPAR
jgi:hypothetical protein